MHTHPHELFYPSCVRVIDQTSTDAEDPTRLVRLFSPKQWQTAPLDVDIIYVYICVRVFYI